MASQLTDVEGGNRLPQATFEFEDVSGTSIREENLCPPISSCLDFLDLISLALGSQGNSPSSAPGFLISI